MYAFLHAVNIWEKYENNPEYIAVCQDILKTEWEVLKRDIENATNL